MNKGIFPKISIVTPSFNQAGLIEETIVSVLSQNYPNLEYIIIDGGSTDGSVDVIKKYADRLSYWVSEPDKGRGDAVNKGFKHSTGEIMTWIGCGDLYCPWAFELVNDIFISLPEIEWLTSGRPLLWNAEGMPCACNNVKGYSKKAFFEGHYIPFRGPIQQESTFWRRSIWNRAGGYVDEKIRTVLDFELWSRLWQKGEIYTVSVPLGGYRQHPGSSGEELHEECLKTAKEILKKYNKSILKSYYNEIRWKLSRKPILRHLMKYPCFMVDYDLDAKKWVAGKSFL